MQFGKGIYFADMSSKSANYCYATRTKNIGLVLLSEVSACYVMLLYNDVMSLSLQEID